jgi:hypothetical protein
MIHTAGRTTPLHAGSSCGIFGRMTKLIALACCVTFLALFATPARGQAWKPARAGS